MSDRVLKLLRVVAAMAAAGAILTGAWTTGMLALGEAAMPRIVHVAVGGVFVLLLCLGADRTRRWIAGVAVLVAIAEVAGAHGPTDSMAVVVHAVAGPVITALLFFSWEERNPSHRRAAMALPALVLMQIVLGALHRHGATGALLHVCGALVVTLTILIATRRAPSSLAARFCTGFLLAQVALGIAVYVMRMLKADDTVTFVWLTTMHVVIGSAVLVSTTVFAARLRRDSRQNIALGES